MAKHGKDIKSLTRIHHTDFPQFMHHDDSGIIIVLNEGNNNGYCTSIIWISENWPEQRPPKYDIPKCENNTTMLTMLKALKFATSTIQNKQIHTLLPTDYWGDFSLKNAELRGFRI